MVLVGPPLSNARASCWGEVRDSWQGGVVRGCCNGVEEELGKLAQSSEGVADMPELNDGTRPIMPCRWEIKTARRRPTGMILVVPRGLVLT